jgi:hypothetical protein
LIGYSSSTSSQSSLDNPIRTSGTTTSSSCRVTTRILLIKGQPMSGNWLKAAALRGVTGSDNSFFIFSPTKACVKKSVIFRSEEPGLDYPYTT